MTMPTRTIRRALTALFLLTAASAPVACADTAADDESTEDAITQRDQKLGPRLFRDDFAAYLRAEGRSDDDIKKLVYLPNEAVLSPKLTSPRGASAADRIAAYDNAFKAIKPSALYEEGKKTPLAASSDVEKVLREKPVHIVILPGIFSEFIPRTPFDELFSQSSTAKKEWATKGAKVKDARYNVKTLSSDQRPMSELVRVGSIDDASGKPLVTAAYMQAGVGSLEDFGTEAENSEVYLRRLDRYFEAQGGVPDNLYIMGYSRGAVAGLDLVVAAHRAKKPWAPKIKGFISHAGVIYGSQLADASFTGGPSTDMLNTLRAFVGEKGSEGKLESCEGGPRADAGFLLKTRNTGHWTKLLADLAVIAMKLPKHDDVLGLEAIDTNLPNGGRIATFAAKALGIPLPGAPTMEGEGVIDLDLFDDNHCANVESFKATARAIVKGAESLTTKSRVAWWQRPENALPTNVKYFALTGTMGDATSSTPWALTTNDVAYDPGSVDFRSLRGNYYDFLAASGGIQLQDSQVSVNRGKFWPALHNPSTVNAPFNPNQKPIKAYFMGTVGTHHWGLSFPRAFTTQGVEGNPFPRTTLLKTIATFVAQVDRAE